MPLSFLASPPLAKPHAAPPRERTLPHIVTIVIDDFGWGNWGYHAQQTGIEQLIREVQTPVSMRTLPALQL